jgi:F0F1-type ATP synthase membrane subunit a
MADYFFFELAFLPTIDIEDCFVDLMADEMLVQKKNSQPFPYFGRLFFYILHLNRLLESCATNFVLNENGSN